jgi:Holliday junction resolvasome RuvABC DNA-binding subunit
MKRSKSRPRGRKRITAAQAIARSTSSCVGWRSDALFEKTRLALETERGEHLNDVAVFEAMCMCTLEPAPAVSGKPRKPINRIVTYKCEDCFRAWREGRGRIVEITPAAVSLATCDAELVRELGPAVLANGASGDLVDAGDDARCDAVGSKHSGVKTKRRPPPTLTIPKATRDFVWARDHGRCRVPGCRATRNLACHHLEFQSHGGDHDAANIVLLCDGHHKLLHDGLITVTGRAPDELVFMRGGKRLVDGRSRVAITADERVRNEVAGSVGVHETKRSRFEDVVMFEHAKQALMQLGYKARVARAALNEVCAHVGADTEVAALVKAVLDRERDTLPGSATADDNRRDAACALVQLGYPRPIAVSAVDAASAHVGAGADLATLIREALRRCSSGRLDHLGSIGGAL